ncbi:MAG TPA: alpha/beta hydrolase [Caulobacteraceae bacterium]|nr:alpha/beta hydrolase [Caulobacteraceae bacterium]
MAGKRPKGILGLFWACLESSAQGRTEHRPTSADYPDSLVKRVSFTAGGGLGWKLSALVTPRAAPTPWKIVVITGAPSWAEYWAPVLAELPDDREMVVVDRPGFAASEPLTCVPDLQLQADALSPLLQTAPGQRLLLVGQSYGAAIATLMAARHPRGLGGLVLLSSYLGELGPTGRWLIGLGSAATGVIPRDLRNAITEVTQQRDQLALMRRFLPRLSVPVHVVHGEMDDFAPIDAARRLVQVARTRRPLRFQAVPGANHFLNDGPADGLIAALEQCIPAPRPAWSWRWPTFAAPGLSSAAQAS